MKKMQFGTISEREAVELAKQHLEKEGQRFVSVRQCTRKRALKWFGPGVWTLFIEVEDEKEWGDLHGEQSQRHLLPRNSIQLKF